MAGHALRCQSTCFVLSAARKAVGQAAAAVHLLRLCFKPLLTRDREDFLWRMAGEATRCARSGDARQTFAIVRCIAGKKRSAQVPPKSG